MTESSSISRPQRYRVARDQCLGQGQSHELADAASDIADPVAKLRFLRAAINKPAPNSLNSKYLFDRRIALTAIACFAFLVAAYSLGTPESNRQIARTTFPAATPAATTAPQQVAVTDSAIALQPVAESLSTDILGITPTTIWLADHGANWELYSNGLRIETKFTVAGEPRRYRVHDRVHGLQPVIQSRPVGILFHTSESDVWPLDTGFEKQLRHSSTALLKYVQQQRAYNYVIDRFGRVYRLVDDETRANHAGHSVWANGDDVYLDLNSAFLGISFESRWDGGHALPITNAQLSAGRQLTNYLRQRFAIAPEMCTAHGLTSVSPKAHLIGYHLDWARGFPFAAFGLPDQYLRPPPNVALFGFSYDDEFARAVGDGWPGAFAAEAAFAKEALDSGIDVATLRAQRQALYNQWAGETRPAEPDEPTALNIRNTPIKGRG